MSDHLKRSGLLVCMCLNAVAQQGATGTGLVVSGVSLNPSSKNGRPLTYTVTNASDKPVIAYVLRLKFKDKGQTIGSGLKAVTTNAIVPSLERSEFRHSESWTDYGNSLPRCNKGSFPSSVDVVVDLVVFKDGSKAGPDTTKQYSVLMGMLRGARTERTLLKRRLRQGGQKAVDAFLAEKY